MAWLKLRALLILLLAMQSCQRNSAPTLELKVTSREDSLSYLAPLSSSIGTFNLNPTSLSDISCVGLVMSYVDDDYARLNSSSCTTNNDAILSVARKSTRLASFDLLRPATLKVEGVLPETELLFSVIAFQSTDDNPCPRGFGSDFDPDALGYSAPYVIGDKSFTVSDSSSTSIEVDFDSSSTPYLTECEPSVFVKDEGSTTVETVDYADSVLAFWNFNTDLADSASGNNYTFTQSGTPHHTLTPKVGDGYLSCDGSTFPESFVYIDDTGSPNEPADDLEGYSGGDFSISFWFNFGVSSSAIDTLFRDVDNIGITDGFHIYRDSSQEFYIEYKAGGSSNGFYTTGCSTHIADSTYNHFVLTSSVATNTIEVYINNNLCRTYTSATQLGYSFDNDDNFNLCNPIDTAAQTLKMDAVGIWTRVLNSAEITGLYNDDLGLEPF